MGYAGLISDATGVQAPAAVAVIEELMRVVSPTLDHLEPAQFAALARQAREAADQLAAEHAAEGCGECRAYITATRGLSDGERGHLERCSDPRCAACLGYIARGEQVRP